MTQPRTRSGRPFVRWLVIGALLTVAAVGCVQLREFLSLPPPDVSSEWRALIDDLRAFERKIGYRETKNFLALTKERDTFPFCGRSSRYHLPYSYEDPAIAWFDTLGEAECYAVNTDTDVFFGSVEAMGEIGTPVTPSMVSGKLDRFVYLVIHEDCHDQFDLPYGVEEALCNVITYHAMAAFSKEKFRWYSRENRAITNYAGIETRQTRATVQHYARLEDLYARYRRTGMSVEALLWERAGIYADAERALELAGGILNNVIFANFMTYSRHYPYLEGVFSALGHDLASTVEFFRLVDKIKPTRAEVLKRLGLSNEKSVEFVRGYEAAVIETTARALAERKRSER